MQVERRHINRARVIYGATIAFNDRQSTLDCVVQNFSPSGAKVVLENPALLPDRIDLTIARKGRAFLADIVWRNEKEAGLSFRQAGDSNTAVPLDWARRLRDCEDDRRSLKSRLQQLSSEH